MLITKKDAQAFTIPGGTKGILYPPGPKGAFSVAHVSMDGVYPLNGWSVNDKCTETMYVLEGKMRVFVDDKEFEIGPGDLCSIEPGQKYRMEGKGVTVDVITPAWEKSQNHIVESAYENS